MTLFVIRRTVQLAVLSTAGGDLVVYEPPDPAVTVTEPPAAFEEDGQLDYSRAGNPLFEVI